MQAVIFISSVLALIAQVSAEIKTGSYEIKFDSCQKLTGNLALTGSANELTLAGINTYKLQPNGAYKAADGSDLRVMSGAFPEGSTIEIENGVKCPYYLRLSLVGASTGSGSGSTGSGVTTSGTNGTTSGVTGGVNGTSTVKPNATKTATQSPTSTVKPVRTSSDATSIASGALAAFVGAVVALF
jgi:hypothetical protein